MDKGFEIKLPQFEGPFDLLLFFIERDELDIHNIPIASITNDFLKFIHQMQELNMEVASEFILVAATLMRIKAKMLLPRPELDESGNEIDPRQDLVAQLLAYKQIKKATEEMRLMEEDRYMRNQRGNIAQEHSIILENAPHADELNSLTLFKLMDTFEKVMERFRKDAQRPMHTVIQYAYTIEGQKEYVREHLNKHQKISFAEFLNECVDRYHLIFTFMAMLEMLAEQVVTVTIGVGFNNFWLTKKQEAAV